MGSAENGRKNISKSLHNIQSLNTFVKTNKVATMKKIKIANYIFTGLFSAMMAMSATMYIVKHGEIVGIFGGLGFPAFIIYPLAAAKFLGVITLWAVRNKTLKIGAYAGFFFNILLAFGAHVSAGDGEQVGALLALILWSGSFITYQKLASQEV